MSFLWSEAININDNLFLTIDNNINNMNLLLTIESVDAYDEVRAGFGGFRLRLGEGEEVRDGGKTRREVRVEVAGILAAQSLPFELVPVWKGRTRR